VTLMDQDVPAAAGAESAAPDGSAPALPAAPIRRTLRLARPEGARLALATLLGAGTIATSVGLLATSAWMISRAAQHPGVQALALAVVGVRFFGLTRGLLRYSERLVGHDAAFRVLADLRVTVWDKLERLAPAGLPAFRSGDLLARLVADVDVLQDLLLRVIPPYAIAVLVGGSAAALVGFLLPGAGLLLAALLVVAATFVPALTRSLAHRTQARTATARGELSASVVDLLHGAPDLVAYGAAPAQLARTSAADAELTSLARAAARTSGVGSGLTSLLGGLAVWGALLLGLPAVHDGRLRGVLLAVVVLTPLAAFEAVAGLPVAAEALERVRRSAARVFEVLDAPDPVVDPAPVAALPVSAGDVVVRGLSARWPGSSRLALDGIDLDLSAGRRVAVVGPSGAGKSTLAAVLLRFLPYQSGSVRLDGVDLDRLAGDDVRLRIGLAAQDAHVFAGTLEVNLRVARPSADAAELSAALVAARLDGWVASLPDGLGTELGERGLTMSGGQRQRLALARVLLADFPVLVLDEPGEHLDVETADALTADLLDVTRGRTTLLITHRLTGLEEVDEIVFLDGGRVAERGTHAELVAAGGRYAALHAAERPS
jgi:thiol reductant ABC exporter CydC subunit